MKYKYTVKEVQKHIESFDYKRVVFEEEVKGDCLYFNAINKDGLEVSIRADVDFENEVPVKEWLIYERCDIYDWSVIS